jgi:Zn-dependent M28 family amino/carboxypeptidase
MDRSAVLSKGVRAAGATTAALVALAVAPIGTATAAAPSQACDTRANITYEKLLQCLTVEGVMEHQEAFQAIADANDGNRAAGTTGYTESVDYVVDTLEAAGWEVELDEFPFTFVGPSVLQQLTPVSATYETGAYTGTGADDVTGTVIPVDLNLAAPAATTSGCEAADFAGLDFSGLNDIALIQRGFCNFSVKALNAEAAGAEAVIIFNQGTPDRLELIVGTLGGTNVVDIPVVGASYADGVALSAAGATARVMVPEPESRPQVNVIAELPGRNDSNVVMAGAHLDSVQAGPGIQDNGSGSSALLEIAQQVAKLKPENTLRFAWWGAEEAGLIGSTEYVNGLSQAERDRIALYLNFDMIASPNYIFMVYDGDESGWDAPAGVPIPAGSIQIEDLFESYFTKMGIPYDDAQFSGRSDYQAFILNGIPAGGLFTGAEVVKTEAQEAIWGGTAGEWYDPCYHRACDDIDNVSVEALGVNIDAIATAVLTYAHSTETVNGVKGKDVPGGFTLPEPAGPEGTVNLPGGGGLAPDHDHAHDDLD